MTRSLIVVGSGIAGMTTALDAAATFDVTLLTKADLAQSNTRYAQGGVAVVIDDMVDPGAPTLGDSVASHVADTLVAGAGLGDADTVGILCAEGPAAMDELIARGVPFDRHDGELSHGLEAAHAFPRILHAGGDATGAAIAYALIDRLRESAVTVREQTTVVDLLLEDGRCVGVTLLGGEVLRADAVVLATGGAGQLFPFTTNPEVATADGLGMALRAGAVAADLEFYQFHPTSLDAPGNFLVSEAVRGEGAVLIDVDGHRFMPDVHPDAELAPRDVVARGIAQQMSRQPGIPVRLDATALGPEFLARRFPNIDAACRAQGYDWGRVPIPVAPAAHYYMGGIRTDEWGRTSLPGLLAVGEVACNGLHGANRLASNSLLEGAVYGRRVVEGLVSFPPVGVFDDEWAAPIGLDLTDDPDAHDVSRADLQQLMWDAAGLVRDGADLEEAAAELRHWKSPAVTDAKAAEDANLLVVARAVVASALARRESRGGHYRTDFPQTDPAQARHSAIVAHA
ncbi:L-aspartate oxidase [Aeromicrobium fastidiosum]|uniref:L-aspartate oxidase n=1 Tax=Aeromicrobium fastidiosum TaxID=52699 RepID=A0A641AJA3_9ACTN|nr:L-aspartate oxidase [Aeromicrobium fastidiosum]KAA1372236.1 L-aspartate oxidase [Aeromicrobium fastidiosum]MBP2391375.1 L-aspartate oxidase [Aeromicrobium fastidiosum]